ncbi:MAG: 1-acyl-sn-glycerol-3-phosphate acyltransferase [Oscillospiraceae bacterium]|nr:1-acyl-sn-glycerol-3-phosphate acyltransferase [Oscillospiraceae bacterium]
MSFYDFAKKVSYPFIRFAFAMRYEGVENIPAGGGYILACNHRSNFDPILLAHKVPQQIHYLAKVELVRVPVVGGVIRSLGVIPVDRGGGDTAALDNAARLVQNGGVLGMFPEGHRSKTGAPLRPRSGVSVIAGKTGANILPVAVSYTKGVRFRGKVTIRFGEVIPFERLAIDLESPGTIRAASKLIMEEIVAMLEPLPEILTPPAGEDR